MSPFPFRRVLLVAAVGGGLLCGGAWSLAHLVGSGSRFGDREADELPRRDISLAVAGSGLAAALDLEAEVQAARLGQDGKLLGVVTSSRVVSRISEPIEGTTRIVIERNGVVDTGWVPAGLSPEPFEQSFDVFLGEVGGARAHRFTCTGRPPGPDDELVVRFEVDVRGVRASDSLRATHEAP